MWDPVLSLSANGIAPLRVFTTRISIDGFWLVVRITSRKIKAKLFEAILASTQPQRLYLTSNLKSTTQITYVSTAKLDENKGASIPMCKLLFEVRLFLVILYGAPHSEMALGASIFDVRRGWGKDGPQKADEKADL